MGIKISGGMSPQGKIIMSNIPPLLHEEVQKLSASDGGSSHFFGISCDINDAGNVAVIGARGHTSSTGAAYIFTESGGAWTQQQILTASDGGTTDFFGYSVAINALGDVVIIGAHQEDSLGGDSGAAYVFTESGGTWTQQQKLIPSDGNADDFFGYSVDINGAGDRVIVGAVRNDVQATDAGAAYVFTESGGTWSEQDILHSSGASSGDAFGASVAIDSTGTTVIVGANDDQFGTATTPGAVYVFTESGGTWTEQASVGIEINNLDFGIDVSISGDGSKFAVGTGSLRVYIFSGSGATWTLDQTIDGTADTASDFGEAVSLSKDGETLVIGAQRSDSSLVDSGKVYIYVNSGGSYIEESVLVANDESTSDQNGSSVAISSDGMVAISGAWVADVAASNSGAAYVYNKQ